MSEADDLHERLFGWRPAKDGTAYERLAAVVMARLGWSNVQHDVSEQPADRVARHQIDVTATHPSGAVQRLIVECKDWKKTVGKGTLDTLVGVRSQVGADAAAVVTTVGFKEGALKVAADEDIAMIVLRPPCDEDDGRFIKRVEIEGTYLAPTFAASGVTIKEGQGLAGSGQVRFEIDGDTQFRRLDGTPAETFDELASSQAAPMTAGDGSFARSASFPDGRLITASDGTDIPISELRWTETVTKAVSREVIEQDGDPCLVLEQLDAQGVPVNGRLLVDEELFAWDIADDGAVSPRGPLSSGSA